MLCDPVPFSSQYRVLDLCRSSNRFERDGSLEGLRLSEVLSCVWLDLPR